MSPTWLIDDEPSRDEEPDRERDARLERERKEAESAERLARVQRKENLESVMATEGGRRFMWRLLYDICGWGDAECTGNGIEHAALIGGRRAVARELVLELQRVMPVLYATMVNEHAADFMKLARERKPEQ